MPCCKCFLFDFDCIKSWVPINPTVQKDKPEVISGINNIHNIDFINLFGQTCFDLLCTYKSDDDTPVIITDLLNKMEPWFSWLLFVSLLNSMPYNASGFQIQAPQNSTLPTNFQYSNSKQDAMEKINYYYNVLIEWIQDNLTDLQYYLPCLEICKSCCKNVNKCSCVNSTPNLFYRTAKNLTYKSVNRYN